jgi:hypothetical protein
MRNTMNKWMLGTALVAGLLGTGAASAKAEVREFRTDRGFYREPVREYVRPGFGVGVAVGGPVVAGPVVASAYIPPCPGDGYFWTAGYYNAGVWVPGRWVFRGGVGPVAHFDRGPVYDHGFDRGFDRGFHGRR